MTTITLATCFARNQEKGRTVLLGRRTLPVCLTLLPQSTVQIWGWETEDNGEECKQVKAKHSLLLMIVWRIRCQALCSGPLESTTWTVQCFAATTRIFRRALKVRESKLDYLSTAYTADKSLEGDASPPFRIAVAKLCKLVKRRNPF